jgi:proteasome lid subunit RPN8/RPN11
MNRISQGIRKFLEGLLTVEQKKFSQITIHKSVIEDIIDFAKSNSPNEFIAVLQGQVEGDTLIVTGLLYQHFYGSRTSSLVRMNLPMLSNAVGSVHSHPSRFNRPSNADLQFFGKNGMVHLIIGAPYNPENIACYDFEGNRREFTVA